MDKSLLERRTFVRWTPGRKKIKELSPYHNAPHTENTHAMTIEENAPHTENTHAITIEEIIVQ